MRSRPTRSRAGSVLGTILGLLACAGLFAASVYLFRTRADSSAERRQQKPEEQAASERIMDAAMQTAVLRGVDGVQGSGTVTREAKNGQYTVSIRTVPPAIDRQAEAYEVWLLRRRPFAFTRLGEMVTDEVGTFVLDWTSADVKMDVGSYPTVVITKEAKDGNPDPGTHILTGTFE